MYAVLINGNYYLIFLGYEGVNDDYSMLVYKINKTDIGASVQQVGEPMRVAAYPIPANRTQTITIQLSGDNKTATELQIMNMNGQLLDRRTIPAGVRQTNLPASLMSQGTNLIYAIQNGEPVGTTRVIVE